MRVCERCSREQRVVLEPVPTNTLCHLSVRLQKCSFRSYWRTQNSLLRLAHSHSLPVALYGETARRLLCGFTNQAKPHWQYFQALLFVMQYFTTQHLIVFLLSFSVVKFGRCKRLLHCFSITLAADLKSLTYLSSSENFATQYEPTDTSTSSASTLLTPELIFCLRSSKLYNNNKQKLEVSSPPNWYPQ